MNNEIFRFSIVRNPQTIKTTEISNSILQLIDTIDKTSAGRPDKSKHPYYSALLEIKQHSNSREKIIREAKKIDLVETNKLHFPLGKFEERLFDNQLNLEDIQNLVQEIFNTTINKIVREPKFQKDKFLISDSIIVSSIVRPKIKGYRGKLLRMRQAIFLLEFLDKNNKTKIHKKDIRRLLQATVLLPSDLFPIPDNSRKIIENNRKAIEKRKQTIKRKKYKIARLESRLKKNKSTIDELSSAYSKHLFEAKKPIIDTKTQKSKNTQDTPSKQPRLSILPSKKFQKLSKICTDTVLKEVGLSSERIDVMYITGNLEERNLELITELEIENQELKATSNSYYPSNVKYGECTQQTQKLEENTEQSLFSDKRGYVNIMGIQDLLLVRQKLLKYEPGEIAHIENVLEGESKSKKHRKLHRTEETIFKQTEREESIKEELQSSDRFELRRESEEIINQETNIEAGVTVSADYGRINIEAHGNYSNNRSTQEINNSASTYAKEVLSKSVKRIQERVLTKRSRTQLSEIEIINKHSIDNSTNSNGNIVGVYRWVNKFYEAQIVNYGKRVMLEFMIPDPSAFYRFTKAPKAINNTIIQKPEIPGKCINGIFNKLKPSDIEDDYMLWVSKYNVSDISPPPKNYIEINKSYRANIDESNNKNLKIEFPEQNVIAPKGYAILFAEVKGKIGLGHVKSTGDNDETYVSILVGNKSLTFNGLNYNANKGAPFLGIKEWEETDGTYEGPYYWDIDEELNFSSLHDTESTTLSITGFSTLSLSINIGIKFRFQRTKEAYQAWQIATYSAIMEAYNALRLEYEETIQLEKLETTINIEGHSPAVNREIEKTELKKHALSILTGQHFDGFNSMGIDPNLSIPQINNFEKAAQEGEFVRFFEQALEWQHMTYLFYDYFWSQKSNWVDILNIKDIDPLFEKFLKSGFSRIWVPIRPGFESTILNYISNGGEPWTEKHAPISCEHPLTQNDVVAPELSIMDEIKEQLNNDFENRTGAINVVKGSKQIIGVNTIFQEEDVDREILIHLEAYRIAKFISPTEIELSKPYQGENDTLGISIGVKHIGEPWLIEVPTNLVLLDKNDAFNINT